MTDNFVFKKVSEKEFFAMRKQWNTLLEASENDNLFLTWEWQSTWWRVWSRMYGLKLNIITAYNHQEKLVGIAPLYVHNSKILKLIPCMELRLIGSSSGFASTVRSEYLSFICMRENEKSIIREFLSYLWKNEKWDKLILNDVSTDTELFSAISSEQVFDGSSYKRSTLKDYGVKLDKESFPGGLESYQATLGSSMRREAFLRKQRLENTGKVEHKRLDNPADAINLLNSFHNDRWGKDCFDKNAAKFHLALLTYAGSNIIQNTDETLLNDVPISVAYNLDYKDSRYNIQLGFKPTTDKKISVGYLQLGTCLETFFSSSKCRYFDFLAGHGKASFYKDKFSGQGYRLFSMEVIKNRILKLIYYFNDTNKIRRRKKKV